MSVTDQQIKDLRYTLVIDEQQRQFLLTALIQCQNQGYFGADAIGKVEIDVLKGCIDTLQSGKDVINECAFL